VHGGRQCSAGSYGNEPRKQTRGIPTCSTAAAKARRISSSIRFHLPTRALAVPTTPSTVLITSSQPFLLLALHCTAHRPLSRDLSATADLALPVSLALPRLPACLTCLLLAHRLQPSQPLEIGSRKYTSTRTPGPGRGLHRVGYMSTCGAVSFRLGRCSLWIFPGNVRLGRMGGRGSRSTS
jgi:hypothetical protein